MSTSAFKPRMRGHMPQKRFSDQAKAAKAAASRGNYKQPDGLFDRLQLGDKPIWLRIAPEQLYQQEIYDRDQKAVVEVVRPWFESTSHFVPSRKRSFNCSTGAHRNQPCRGCAIRADFYDRLREQEKATEVRDQEKRKNPPIQASTRYAMGVTVLEKIFHLAVTDKNGKVRKNKNGQDIMNWVPAPLSGLPLIKQKGMDGQFAHNFHWGFGTHHLAQLGDMDATLWNYCANCASELMAVGFYCTECEALVYSDENGVTEADLRSVRETEMKCPNCAHEGFTVPELTCTGCDTPEEGSILVFDLQIRAVPIDDKKTNLSMEKFRMPDYIGLFDADTAERVTELVYNPLDIAAIYAPDSVDRQAFSLPDELKAISPSYHLEEKTSQPYGEGDGTADDGDADQVNFDNES